MPQSQIVDPKEVRAGGEITFGEIPINAYSATPKQEVKRYGAERLKRVMYDMLTIREFESMLNDIKMQGSYRGIEYTHKGPAHLSIGQEPTAVGTALELEVEDFIFGSHRSHGEILAKCYSAIPRLDDSALQTIMKEYLGGETLSVAERIEYKDAQDLAENFVLYGTLAEIFARKTGFNRGLGGSMHAFFAPFGSMPNNAIVGGSADIALGSARSTSESTGNPGIVHRQHRRRLMGCGPVWEAMMLSAMDQYRTLWPKDIGGAPPVIFNFINNFYGMGGQTYGETMGFKVLARAGAGVNEDMMHAERVDGYNPLAVADAVARKKDSSLEGRGPVLLDTITYRVSGHSLPTPPPTGPRRRSSSGRRPTAFRRSASGYQEAKSSMNPSSARCRRRSRARSRTSFASPIDLELSPRAPGKVHRERHVQQHPHRAYGEGRSRRCSSRRKRTRA